MRPVMRSAAMPRDFRGGGMLVRGFGGFTGTASRGATVADVGVYFSNAGHE